MKKKRLTRLKKWDLCEGGCGFCYPKVYAACKSRKKKKRGALSRGTLTKHIVKSEMEEMESLAQEIYEGNEQNKDYCKKVNKTGVAQTESFDMTKGGECSGFETERYTE